MKYFLFSSMGEGLPIAYRLQQEGHEVFVGYVDDMSDVLSASEKKGKKEPAAWKKQRLSLFNGMIKKNPAWKLVQRIKSMKDYSDCFVFFDRNNLFRFSKELESLPIAGNFPTEEDYLLEQDRERGKKLVKKYYPALTIPSVKNFSSVSLAVAFLKKSKDSWVLKGRNDDAQTYIPDTKDVLLANQQIQSTLLANKKNYEKSGFILEIFLTSFMEVTPEKIYYDGTPIALLLYFENKPLGSGNTSIQTGCAQDLVFSIPFSEKIHEIAFPPFVDELARKHKGLFYWDASLLLDTTSEKIYFGEFCPNRPGYNQIFSELAQCPSVSHYFESIMKKKSPFTIGKLSGSARMFNLNRDLETEMLSSNIPLLYKKESEKHIWLWDVMKKKNSVVTVGYDISTLVITGVGTSFKNLADSLYNNVENVSFVGSYIRPKFDYMSKEYSTSLQNRIQYGVEKKLYHLPFIL